MSVLWNSVRICRTAGATMEEARGVRNVQVDTRATLVILRREDQFSGHAGSSSPSHPTMLLGDSDWATSSSMSEASCSFVASFSGSDIV